uniref:nuclear pore complex protein Nup205-like n=1 Tax=Monopterus albus TaxID=43700 RepID=UPI0009B45BF2|nr:nuclear pore complex protein Nup205-like [Monopterus albus]
MEGSESMFSRHRQLSTEGSCGLSGESQLSVFSTKAGLTAGVQISGHNEDSVTTRTHSDHGAVLESGEHQQPNFPGLTRGLVAVLLYWDGKLCVSNSLRTLIQSRHGKTFTLDLSGELVALTTRFTDELMSQGLTKRILTLVSEISVTREFERLQKERGLGNEKHRKEVSDLIKECRQALADSLFSWTCQSPLTKDDTLALIGHLETVTAQADGSLDSVNLALVMALLYCLDVSFVEQGTEDREDLLQALPLLTERQYVSAVHSRLMDNQPWKLPGLQAVCRLAWALSLRVLSQLPQGSALVEFTEADEALADQALLGDVFLFMKEGMLGCESFSQEEFYIRRLHSLITDFLALMPMKVKQLRNRADEDARLVHMSLQMDSELPSSLRKDLDHLLILSTSVYTPCSFVKLTCDADKQPQRISLPASNPIICPPLANSP